MTTDKAMWDGLVAKELNEATLSIAQNPPLWRSMLVDWIRELGGTSARCLEVGSGAGYTSLLMPSEWERVLLDYSEPMVHMAKELFSASGQPGSFVVGDMFQMPFDDASFDIVFNSGVFEHYDAEDRGRAIRECGRILKPGGHLIVGVPNHYHVPYRIGYALQNLTGRWEFPSELPIRDLKSELDSAGLTFVRRFDCDPRASIGFLSPYPLLRYPFAAWTRLSNAGGYLRVITAQRPEA